MDTDSRAIGKRVVGWRGNGTGRCHLEPAAGRTFDRLMNWVVGALLVAATVAVVVIQANPPR